MSRCGCESLTCACLLQADNTTTTCIDVTVEGVGTPVTPYKISAEIVRDPVAGNQLTCGANGLLVPAAAADPDVAVFFKTGSLTVGAGTSRFKFPFGATIISVTCAVNTAPTGADIILDVNLNGVTIFTAQANRPRILAGTFQETVDAVPDVTAVTNDQYLTVDLDQVGATIAGAELTVFILYSRP